MDSGRGDRSVPTTADAIDVLVVDDDFRVARVHRAGQVIQSRHLDDGTELHVRVNEQLAAELSEFGC